MPYKDPDSNIKIGGEIHSMVNIANNGLESVCLLGEDIPFVQSIFVSYASTDRERFIEPIVEWLQSCGYHTWYDRENIEGGDHWKHEIDQGLRRSMAVVIALTKSSVDFEKHPWAHYEHMESLRLFAPIIPIMLEKCDYPEYFQRECLQYIDMTTPNDKAYSKLRAAIEKKIRRRGRGGRRIDQTPGAYRTFIGREDELRNVYKLMREESSVAATSRVAIAIQGMGGVGKTMLAGELVRRLGPRYPGGVLVEQRGQNPTDDAQSILHKWAQYAGQKPEGVITPEQVRGWLDSAGELLVLIDDVWREDYKEIKQLLAALPPDADRIITTRFTSVATGLGAKLYQLDCLSENDGINLLKDRFLHKKGSMPSDTLLLRVHTAVGGHALLMELFAGRVFDLSNFEERASQLEQRICQASDLSHEVLDLPDIDRDVSLLASLNLSFQELQRIDEHKGSNLTECFPKLGVFAPESALDVYGVSAIWEEEDTVAREHLNTLVDLALLSTDDAHYRQHSILQSYAMGLLKTDDSKVQATAIRHSVYYMNVSRSIEELWQEVDRHSSNIAHAAKYVCGLLGEDVIRGLGEPLHTESINNFDKDTAELALELATSTKDYVYHRRVMSGVTWLRAGLAAARLLENIQEEGMLLNEIAGYLRYFGQMENAQAYYEQALYIHMKLGNQRERGLVLNNIGLLFHKIGQPERAIAYHKQAFSILERLEKSKTNLIAMATILNNLGTAYNQVDQPETAISLFEATIPILENSGNKVSLSKTLNNIGLACHIYGDDNKALMYYEQALSLLIEMGHHPGIATALFNIAYLLRQSPLLNRKDEAITILEEAIALLEEKNLLHGEGGTTVDFYRQTLRQWYGTA